jgi:hypothetical protein
MTKVYAVVRTTSDEIIAVFSTEEKAVYQRDALQAVSDERDALDAAWQELYRVAFDNACADENIVFHDKTPMTPERRAALDRAYRKVNYLEALRPTYDGFVGGSGDYQVKAFDVDT